MSTKGIKPAKLDDKTRKALEMATMRVASLDGEREALATGITKLKNEVFSLDQGIARRKKDLSALEGLIKEANDVLADSEKNKKSLEKEEIKAKGDLDKATLALRQGERDVKAQEDKISILAGSIKSHKDREKKAQAFADSAAAKVEAIETLLSNIKSVI